MPPTRSCNRPCSRILSRSPRPPQMPADACRYTTALRASAGICRHLQARSQAMAQHDAVGHQSSDGTGPFDHIKVAARYTYRPVAEHVAWRFVEAPEAVVAA